VSYFFFIILRIYPVTALDAFQYFLAGGI